MKQKYEEQDSCTIWRKALNWIVQIIVIVSWVIMLLGWDRLVNEKDSGYTLYTVGMVFLMIFYATYVMFQVESNTFFYMLNFSSNLDITSYMEKLFQTPMTIQFYAEAYHYERRSNGKGGSSSHKVVTHSETTKFLYQFCRDNSGVFNLDTSKNTMYIKLNLGCMYSFYNHASKEEYAQQYNDLKARYSILDTHHYVSASNFIEGMDGFILIKLKSGFDFLMNIYAFIFFTFIIPIGQFFKLYINWRSTYQQFIIKKCLSTNVDLNSDAANRNLEKDSPKIIQAGNDILQFKHQSSLVQDNYVRNNDGEIVLRIENNVSKNQQGQQQIRAENKSINDFNNEVNNEVKNSNFNNYYNNNYEYNNFNNNFNSNNNSSKIII